MTRLHVWLDGRVTAGMHGVGASCMGHGGMLGIFTLGGAGSNGILGGGGAVGTLRGGVAVGTGTFGGRARGPDQRVIGGMVGLTGLGKGRANCMIVDNCISACVCSMPNCAVGEAGCGCWRAAMSSCIECVVFFLQR